MNSLDIFGSKVSVIFQGSSIHKTKFGVLLTVALFIIIMSRLGILVKNVLSGRNPIVLYQERQVQDPKKFTITPDTLPLAIGVLDTSYNYYIDNSLFTIQGVHKKKQNVFNSTTSQYDEVFSSRVFNLVNCTDDNVPDPKLREFFLKSQLRMHQCIPKDLVVEIEGQFNSDSYQELNFYFYKCTGQGCKDEKDINALINNNYIELLFTDVYFAPENKDNPFVKFSRDLYWTASQNLPKEVNVFLRNNYVESDFGWITSDIKSQVYPSFSYNDNQIIDASNSFFFHLVIRFEKEKENLYKRTYDNLFTIMSQIGGFYQILFTIFSIISFKYSQIHLGISLINDFFDFQDISNKSNDDIQIKNLSQINQNNDNTNVIDSKDIQKQVIQNNPAFKRIINETTHPQSQIDQFQNIQSSQIYNKDLNISFEKEKQQIQHDNLNLQQQQSKNKEAEEVNQNSRFEEILSGYQDYKILNQNGSRLKLNAFSYLLSFFTKYYKKFKIQKQVIDYGLQDINKNIDIKYIIKKCNEIDKLKRIILDDDQLALFNFIPKPQIVYKFHQEQGVVINKNSSLNRDDNLDDFQQFKNVKQSFNHIYHKKKLTKIDYRVLSLLDQKQYQVLQNDKYLQQKFQNNQSNLSINSPYNQNLSSNIICMRNQVNLEENFLDSFDDCFDKNKIKKYSISKQVRNPNLYFENKKKESQFFSQVK
ncbi:hypothetical protein ABPG74_005909 [Tetrahymena malaccensis]